MAATDESGAVARLPQPGSRRDPWSHVAGDARAPAPPGQRRPTEAPVLTTRASHTLV